MLWAEGLRAMKCQNEGCSSGALEGSDFCKEHADWTTEHRHDPYATHTSANTYQGPQRPPVEVAAESGAPMDALGTATDTENH
jgi:hypothetical protein